MIDWQSICDEWNKRTSNRHSVAEMLEHLYLNQGSLETMGNYLGVSSCAIARHMDRLDIKRKHYDRFALTIAGKLAKYSDEQLVNLTAKQLAHRLGNHPYSIRAVLRDLGRRCKSGVKTKKAAGKTSAVNTGRKAA